MKQDTRTISNDYIRGLVAGGSGTFTFTTTVSGYRQKRVPSFQLRMSVRNKGLIEKIKNYLGLRNNIYIYQYSGKDGYRRNPFAMLIVRDLGSLKNKIIPLFYDQLIGSRSRQFDEWLEKIGTDQEVAESYRILYRLHKSGYFRRELCRGGLFEKFIV